MDRDALITHYRRMSQEQFTYFATHEVAGLTPDAVEVLRQEMVARRIVPDPDATIDVQLRRLSSEEFERMVTRFRQEPCPLCGASQAPLNGIRMNRAGNVELIAGCEPCLVEQLKSANMASASLGLITRPVHAIGAVAQNDAELSELKSGNQTQALREYVWFHRGEWAHFLK